MPWFHRSKSLGNTRNSTPHLPLPLTSLYPSLRPLPVEDRPVSLKRTEYSQCKLHPHFLSIVSDAKKKKRCAFVLFYQHSLLCVPPPLPSFLLLLCSCRWTWMYMHMLLKVKGPPQTLSSFLGSFVVFGFWGKVSHWLILAHQARLPSPWAPAIWLCVPH